jgi:hypothetical protein
MKTTAFLFLLMVSIGAARAQDADYSNDEPVGYPVMPSVVYNAPVIYNAPVVYNAPVAYNAPVYYGLSAANCAFNACAALQNNCNVGRSTVTYIGGGHVSYQVARCNSGSTVTYIGGSFRH